MSGARWDRVVELFEGALEVPEAERPAWLHARCGDDPSLEAEVLELLRQSAESPTGFLDSPLLETRSRAVSQGLRVGEFEVVEELGRGGMGVVYRARQPSLGREVALKVLVQSLTTTAAEVERFHREARAVAKLAHPHIVPVLADGTAERVHWFAMELVPGHDLEAEMAIWRGEDGRAPLLAPRGRPEHLRTVADLVANVADALQHAHDHGVVHRDVKPKNLLLDREGRVRIVDFGIARDEALGTLTQSGQMIGSLHYMSPEQARVIRNRIDHRTDVYSLGVVLYELLTGRRPYTGSTSHELMLHLRQGDPPPVRRIDARVPRDLALVCHKAMAHAPAERYTTAAAFRDDLRRFLGHEAVQAEAPSALRRLERSLVRHRVRVTVAAVAALALFCGSWWSTHTARARALERTYAQLHSLDRATDWSELSVESLLAARRTLDECESEGAPTAERRVLLARLRTRVDAEITAWRTRGTEEIASGIAEVAANEEASGYERVTRGILRLQEATLLSGTEDSLVDPTVFAPRLSVPGPANRQVFVQVLDLETSLPGELRALGETPLHEVALPVGFLRIVLREDGAPLRELTRSARPGDRFEIEPNPSQTLVPDGSMVLVPGGLLRVDDDRPLCPLEDRTVSVAPFRVDAHEVTIGEYLEYLDETPAAPRPVWPAWLDTDSVDRSLPAVDLTWEEALAFAEWRGQRLLGYAEWMWLTRGVPLSGEAPSDAAAPMRDWPAAESGAALTGPLAEPTSDLREMWTRFLATAAPVGSHPASALRGVHDLFGNVSEWTESLVVERDSSGRWRGRTDSRFTVGLRWIETERGPVAAYSAIAGIGPAHRSLQRGFRCARSVLP